MASCCNLRRRRSEKEDGNKNEEKEQKTRRLGGMDICKAVSLSDISMQEYFLDIFGRAS